MCDYSERLLWCGWAWPQGMVTIVLSKAGNVADSDISIGLHNDLGGGNTTISRVPGTAP